MNDRAPYALIAAAVVALDQITKDAVQRAIPLHGSRPVIDGLLSLTHGRNPGIAFGVLSEGSFPFQAVALTAMSAVAVIALSVYAFKVPPDQKLRLTGLALVVGGAIGNLIDRVRYGSVVDFIHVYWRSHQWPDFNVADSAITTAVVLLLLEGFVFPGKR
jgi:signal peptidase II